MLSKDDVGILFAIAQRAVDGAHWPSLREDLLDIASAEDLNRVWMAAAAEAGRVPEPLMED